MVDDVHPRDFEILSKVAAGRTLFVDVFALSQLKQAGLVKSVDRGTHTAWELTDAGRKRLEAEKQRREDDARRTSDASASSNAGKKKKVPANKSAAELLYPSAPAPDAAGGN
jgi:DNA-binding PadR family transcriptional regulator